GLPFPDISANIRHGNALLEPMSVPDTIPPDIRRSLAPFSWDSAFSVFDRLGGFDCILANPPYGLSRDDQISPEELALLRSRYAPYISGKVNKYLLFMTRAYELLNDTGRMSFLVPNAWLGIG